MERDPRQQLDDYRLNEAGAAPSPGHVLAARTLAAQALVPATLILAALAGTLRP